MAGKSISTSPELLSYSLSAALPGLRSPIGAATHDEIHVRKLSIVKRTWLNLVKDFGNLFRRAVRSRRFWLTEQGKETKLTSELPEELVAKVVVSKFRRTSLTFLTSLNR